MSEEIFISYSSKNEGLANEFKQYLEAKGASVFVASASVEAGTKWSPTVVKKLRESEHVILLASKDSCESHFVNQEIGGSIVLDKPLTPILCGIDASELPGWSKEFQAVQLTDDRSEVRGSLDKTAWGLKVKRIVGWTILIALGIWFAWALFRKKPAVA